MPRHRITDQNSSNAQLDDPSALFVDTFQAQHIRLAVDPIKVSTKSIFHEDIDFVSFFQTTVSDSFPENETQNTDSDDTSSTVLKQQRNEHETLRKIRKLMWQDGFAESYQNTQSSRYAQKFQNRAYGLSQHYQLQSSKQQQMNKTILPLQPVQPLLLTLCQEAFLPLLQSTSKNDPRACLSVLEAISKFLSKEEQIVIHTCDFTNTLQEQLSLLVSISDDNTIFLKASQILLELGFITGSAKFLLAFVDGLLKNHNKPGTLQIGKALRKITSNPSQINFPQIYLAEYDLPFTNTNVTTICTDGQYLYLNQDGVQKIGTPKVINGLLYGTYRSTNPIESICYLHSMKKLVCLEAPSQVGASQHRLTIQIVNPESMELEATLTIENQKEVASVEHSWLAADFEHLYLARKTLGELHFQKILLNHSAESGYSHTSVDTFSCLHYWGSNKAQFWTDGKQFISMSFPSSGQYNLWNKEQVNGSVTSCSWNYNYPTTVCFDIASNKTWILPTYSPGKVQLYKNSGAPAVIPDESSYFAHHLKSQDAKTVTNYLSQLPDELDVPSALTAVLGYLDLIATPFCSHLESMETSFTEKYCLELCKTTFVGFPDLLAQGIHLSETNQSKMTDADELPRETFWLLVILKLLRIHFIRAVDLTVDPVALQLTHDPLTPNLSEKIQPFLVGLLNLSENPGPNYLKLLCQETARTYSAGLSFFFPNSESRTKFINELLFSSGNSPSKQILLEEICEDISLPSLTDVAEKPKEETKPEVALLASSESIGNNTDSNNNIDQSAPASDPMQTEQNTNNGLTLSTDTVTTETKPTEGNSAEKPTPPKLESVLEELHAMTKSLTTLVITHNQSYQLAALQGRGHETPYPTKPVKLVLAIQQELFSYFSTKPMDTSTSMQLVSKAVTEHAEFILRGACQYLRHLSDSILLMQEPISEETEKKILRCLENSVIMKDVIPTLMLNINVLRSQAKNNKPAGSDSLSVTEKLAEPLREFCFSLQSILNKLPSIKSFEESVQQFYQKRYVQVIETPHPTLYDFRLEGDVKFPTEVTCATCHFDSRCEKLKIRLDIGNQSIRTIPALPALVTGNQFHYNIYPKQSCWGVKMTLIGHTATGDVTMMDHTRSKNTTQFLYDVYKFGWNLLSHVVSRMITGIPLSTQEEEHGHWLQSQIFSAGVENPKKPFSLLESRSGATFEDKELYAFVEDLLVADKTSIAGSVFKAMKGNRDHGGKIMDTMERYIVAVLLKHNNLIPDAIRCSESLATQPKLPPRLDFVWKTVVKMRNFITQKHQDHKKNNADASDEDVYKQLCDQVIQTCKLLLQYAPASHLQIKNYLETAPHPQPLHDTSAEHRRSLKRSNTVLIEENEPKQKTQRTLSRTASTISESPSLNNSFNDNNNQNKLSRVASTYYPRTIRRSTSSLNFENPTPNQESVKKTLLRAGSTMIAIQRWKLRAFASPQVSEECQKTSRVILKIIQSGVDLESLLARQKDRAVQRTEGLKLANEMILKSEFPSTKEDLLTMLIIELYEAGFAGYRDNIQAASDSSSTEARNSFWTLLHTILQLLPQQSPLRKPLFLSFLGLKFSPLLDLPRINQFKVLEYLFGELKKTLESENQSPEMCQETHSIQFTLLGIIETCLFGHEAKAITEDIHQFVDEESYLTLRDLLTTTQSNAINTLHQLVGIFIKKGFALNQARKANPGADTTAFQNFEKTLFLFLGSITRLANNSVASKLFGVQFTGDLVPLCALGSLRCTRSVFRILRKMFPKFAPAALDNHLQTSTVTAGVSLPSETPLASLFNIGPKHLVHNILEALLLEIGKMYRLESAENSLQITTGRSFLAIQSEIVMLVRILLEAPAWKSDLISRFASSLSMLGTVLEGGIQISWTDTLASCFGALAVFGGHIDVLRVGGRCSIGVENGSGVSDRGVIVQWDMSPTANYLLPHPTDVITPSEMVEMVNGMKNCVKILIGIALVVLDSCCDSSASSVECQRLTPIAEISPNTSTLSADSEIIPRLLHLTSALSAEITPKHSHPIRVQALSMISAILCNFFQDQQNLTHYSSLLKKTGFAAVLMKMALEPMPAEANECSGLTIEQLQEEYNCVAMRLRDVLSDTYQVSIPLFVPPPTLTLTSDQQPATTAKHLKSCQDDNTSEATFTYYNCTFQTQQARSGFAVNIGALVKVSPSEKTTEETAQVKNLPGILCGTTETQSAVCFFDEESSLIKNIWIDKTSLVVWKGSITVPPEYEAVPFNPKLVQIQATHHLKSLAISYAREILISIFCEPESDLVSSSDRSDIIRFTKLFTGKFVQIFDLYLPFDDSETPIADNSINWRPGTPFSHDKLLPFQENIMKLINSFGMVDMVVEECMDFFKSSPWTVSVESPKNGSRQNSKCHLYFPGASVLYFFGEENKSFRVTVMDSRTNRETSPDIPCLFFQDQVMFKTGPNRIFILPIGSRMVDSGALTKSNSHFIWWILSITPTSYPQIFSRMLNNAFYNGLIEFCKRKDMAYVLTVYGIKWLTCAIYTLLKEVEEMKDAMDELNQHWFLEQDFSKLEYFLKLVNQQTKVRKEDNFKIQFKVAVELVLAIVKTKNLLKSFGKLQEVPKPLLSSMDVSMISETKPEEKKEAEKVESNDNMEEDKEELSQKEDAEEKDEDEKEEEEKEDEEDNNDEDKENESQRNESQIEDPEAEGKGSDAEMEEPWPSMRLDVDSSSPSSTDIPTWINTLLSLSSVLSAFASSKERTISPEWMQAAILELVKPPEVFESTHPYGSGKNAHKDFSHRFPDAKMLIFRFDTNTRIQESDELVLETAEGRKDIISLGKDTSTSKLDQTIAECDGNFFRGYFNVNPSAHSDAECCSCYSTEGTLFWCLICLEWYCQSHMQEHSSQEPGCYFAKFRRPREEDTDTDELQDVSLPAMSWADGVDHIGTQCANCSQSPIRGIRYKCGNCGVNLCETCEDLEIHDLTHVFIRLHRPVPPTAEDTLKYPSRQQVNWGFKFSVQPVYDTEALKVLAASDKDKIVELLHLLEGWSLEDDIALVTFINDLGKDPLLMVHTDITSELIAANTKASNASLQSIPIEKVQARFAVLKYLNHQLDQLLPVFDTQSPTVEPWTLSHLLRGIKPLIFLEVKLAFLDKKTQTSSEYESREIILDRGVSGKNKEPLFVQAFKQLKSEDYDYLKIPTEEQAFQVKFIGEGSQDAGGPYAEAITTMVGEIQSSDIPLFIPCPNKTGEVGLNRDKFVPNPSMTSPLHLEMFKLVGALMGISIRSNSCIPLNLPSLFWKKLIGEKGDRSDLLAIDQICIQSLDTLNNIEQEGITRETFSDAISFTFTTTSSDGREVELKEGGKNIEVTWDNRHEYAKIVEEYRLREFDRQIQAIEAGLRNLIPSEFFTLCTWQEIELRVCGKPEINLELLKQQTEYLGLSSTEPVVQNFWKALESFSHEQRSLFLRFTSGRTRLPTLLSDFSKKFQLMKFGLVVNNPDSYLPTAHTCFFQLELPNYSCYEVLRAKLLFAVTECKAIDTDFNVRDEDIDEY